MVQDLYRRKAELLRDVAHATRDKPAAAALLRRAASYARLAHTPPEAQAPAGAGSAGAASGAAVRTAPHRWAAMQRLAAGKNLQTLSKTTDAPAIARRLRAVAHQQNRRAGAHWTRVGGGRIIVE